MDAPNPSPDLSRQIVVYDQARDVPAFIAQIGEAIYRSAMFGAETPSQGYVLALECAAKKLPPLSLAERYHFIKGKLSIKAEHMLAEFHAAGGTHRIVTRTPDRASIELSKGGQTEKFLLSWEDAAKEPFVYEGREADVAAALAAGQTERLKLKPKYSTPRSRMQMLWARVVSDGVRSMAPEVLSGGYTPEEVSDFTGAPLPADTDEADAIVATPAPSNGQAKPEPTLPPPAQQPDPVEAEINRTRAEAEAGMARARETEAKLAADAPAPEPEPATPDTAGLATAEQVAEVKQLVGELGITREKLAEMLGRVGVSKVSDLSQEHCAALLVAFHKEKYRRGTRKN